MKKFDRSNPKTAAGKSAKLEELRKDVKAGKKPLTEKQAAAKNSKATGQELATTGKSALPPSRVAMGEAGGDVQGEVDSSDIKLPYLAVVQGVGDLSTLFTPGQLILAGEIELTPPPVKDKANPPVDVVIVWARKQFLEKLPYGSDEMPRIFDTSAEAEEAGLTTAWIDNEPPSAGPMLTCLVLVEAPSEDVAEDGRFSLEYDGRKFAPCLWRIKSTAYNRAGKAILTAKALCKTEPLCSRKFSLSTKREKVGENWIFTPAIRAVGKSDADFVSFVNENAK